MKKKKKKISEVHFKTFCAEKKNTREITTKYQRKLTIFAIYVEINVYFLFFIFIEFLVNNIYK